MAKLCLVTFLYSPFSDAGPIPGPGPLWVRAEAPRGLGSPAPSPAALNNNLIKFRRRLPRAWGALTTELASFCKQLRIGVGRLCVCAWKGSYSGPYLASPKASHTAYPVHPSDHPIPVCHPSAPLAPISFISFSSAPFSFFSQPGSVSVSLSVLPLSFLYCPQIFWIWFPVVAPSPASFSLSPLLHLHLAVPQGCPLSFCLSPSSWLSLPHLGLLSHHFSSLSSGSLACSVSVFLGLPDASGEVRYTG